MSEIRFQSVGTQLKQARAQLQVRLKDVAHATKIQPWVLEALEEDRLQTTMSPVYVKGFLRTYATFLRLDAAILSAQLFPVATEGSGLESQPALRAQTPRLDLSGLWGVMRRLVPLAVGAVALAGVVALNPVRWMAARIPAKLASVTVTPTQPSPRDMRSMSGTESPKSLRDFWGPREALLHLEPTQPLELSIAARQESWVSVVADGRLVAQRPLRSGDQETWRARRRFELIVGTPSRVEIFLNGQSISPFAMAHQGRLTITHQSIRPLEERTAPAARTAASPDAQ